MSLWAITKRIITELSNSTFCCPADYETTNLLLSLSLSRYFTMDNRSCLQCIAKLCDPTKSPTDEPSENPSHTPTQVPSDSPTSEPTHTPTGVPTGDPTDESQTLTPTQDPSASPSDEPSKSPTQDPSASPSDEPSKSPTQAPTSSPSDAPSMEFPQFYPPPCSPDREKQGGKTLPVLPLRDCLRKNVMFWKLRVMFSG